MESILFSVKNISGFFLQQGLTPPPLLGRSATWSQGRGRWAPFPYASVAFISLLLQPSPRLCLRR